MEAGESYEQAAIRELREELGIKNVELSLVGCYQVDKPEPYNAAVYACQYDGKQLKGWEAEADILDFLTQEEIVFLLGRFPYLFTGGLKKAMEMISE